MPLCTRVVRRQRRCDLRGMAYQLPVCWPTSRGHSSTSGARIAHSIDGEQRQHCTWQNTGGTGGSLWGGYRGTHAVGPGCRRPWSRRGPRAPGGAAPAAARGRRRCPCPRRAAPVWQASRGTSSGSGRLRKLATRCRRRSFWHVWRRLRGAHTISSAARHELGSGSAPVAVGLREPAESDNSSRGAVLLAWPPSWPPPWHPCYSSVD